MRLSKRFFNTLITLSSSSLISLRNLNICKFLYNKARHDFYYALSHQPAIPTYFVAPSLLFFPSKVKLSEFAELPDSAPLIVNPSTSFFGREPYPVRFYNSSDINNQLNNHLFRKYLLLYQNEQLQIPYAIKTFPSNDISGSFTELNMNKPLILSKLENTSYFNDLFIEYRNWVIRCRTELKQGYLNIIYTSFFVISTRICFLKIAFRRLSAQEKQEYGKDIKDDPKTQTFINKYKDKYE